MTSTKALTRTQLRRLRDLADQLTVEDPALAASLTWDAPAPTRGRLPAVCAVMPALAMVLAVVGLATSMPVVFAIGLVMLAVGFNVLVWIGSQQDRRCRPADGPQ